MRSLRVYGDENAMPAIGAQKTIHHRNKSSPALSTLKGAAKRTAFGDVSNTTNVARPSKDDSVLGTKGNSKLANIAQEIKKPAVLQRPAQRPLSVSELKSLLGVSNVKEPIVKQPLAEIQQAIQPVTQATNTRKIVAKKSTAVFKDVVTVLEEHREAEHEDGTFKAAPVAPVHRELMARQIAKPVEVIAEAQPRHGPNKEVTALHTGTMTSAPAQPSVAQEEARSMRSDGVYIDGNGAIQLYDFDAATEQPEETVDLARYHESTEYNTDVARVQAAQAKLEASQKRKLPLMSEPEEYWDDDAGEAYEEEGYVTARSFKSRTDNTTVLFPKVSLKIKKEIADAKLLIESSKTAEELEDEAWDTTMVAEYGDEIFGYMKDLEVRDWSARLS